MDDELKKQIDGARTIFFGILKGIDGSINLKPPSHVYHYTNWDSFCSMIKTNSVRLYTVRNFNDPLERKHQFALEGQVQGKITNSENGEQYNISNLLNNELSNDHIFIQSNTTSNENKYLWENYGDQGRGICLCFSTANYLKFLNETLPDFDLLPVYFKCCYVSYDHEWADQFMESIFPALHKNNGNLGGAANLVWFIFLEYWRSLFKTPAYKAEAEFRFIVPDSYSVFLFICSLLAKWGHFSTSHPQKLSEEFHRHYLERKHKVHEQLNFTQTNNSGFVSVPLDIILDSITIGPKSNLTKTEVSIKSNHIIKKSKIKKSFLIL